MCRDMKGATVACLSILDGHYRLPVWFSCRVSAISVKKKKKAVKVLATVCWLYWKKLKGLSVYDGHTGASKGDGDAEHGRPLWHSRLGAIYSTLPHLAVTGEPLGDAN